MCRSECTGCNLSSKTYTALFRKITPAASFATGEFNEVFRSRISSARCRLFWNHQTGGMSVKAAHCGGLSSGRLRHHHFTTSPLLCGPEILTVRCFMRTVKILTAHEWWLLCALSTLWKFDEDACRERVSSYRLGWRRRRQRRSGRDAILFARGGSSEKKGLSGRSQRWRLPGSRASVVRVRVRSK